MIVYLPLTIPLVMVAILMTIGISCAIVEQVFGMNTDEFKHDYEQFCQNNDLLVFGFTFETEYLRRQDNYKHCQVCTLPIENIEYSILTRRDNYCVLTHCGHFFFMRVVQQIDNILINVLVVRQSIKLDMM